jgi:hypothetical protein
MVALTRRHGVEGRGEAPPASALFSAELSSCLALLLGLLTGLLYFLASSRSST